MAKAQRECPEMSVYIKYLEGNELPNDEKLARKIVNTADHYVLLDGVLYHLFGPRRKRANQLDAVIRQLCVPISLRDKVIKAYHHHLCHIGLTKCYETLRQYFYWPTVYQDLYQALKECVVCQQTKRKYDRKAPLQPLQTTKVMSVWHMDHIKMHCESEGMYNYVLVLVDRASLFCELIPCVSTNAEPVAEAILNNIVFRYGRMDAIFTDRHVSFHSNIVSSLEKLLGVKHIFTSSYHAQSNSRAEQQNAQLLRSLRTLCVHDHSDWSLKLQAVAAAHRAAFNSSIGMSPYFCLYGREMPLAIHTELLPELLEDSSIGQYVRRLLPRFDIIQKIASENQRDSQEKSRRAYDKHAAIPPFSTGSNVLMYDPVVKPGFSPKLWRFWKGPYTIVDSRPGWTYKLVDRATGTEQPVLVHANRLKPFYGQVSDEFKDKIERAIEQYKSVAEQRANSSKSASSKNDVITSRASTFAPPGAQKSKTRASNTTTPQTLAPQLPPGYYQVKKLLKR
jgi:hypothetical protein